MKHKHYDVLIAIAEGKAVEFCCADEWITATIEDSITNPLTHYHFEWRIKKEPVIEVNYFIIQVPLSYPQTAISYLEIVPDLERYDLKITYQDGKAVKAELSE